MTAFTSLPVDVANDAVRAVEDAIDEHLASTGYGHRELTGDQAPAVLDALLELGWTPPVVCDCYPGGFTPDSYEGPQRDCPVHGENAAP